MILRHPVGERGYTRLVLPADGVVQAKVLWPAVHRVFRRPVSYCLPLVIDFLLAGELRQEEQEGELINYHAVEVQ